MDILNPNDFHVSEKTGFLLEHPLVPFTPRKRPKNRFTKCEVELPEYFSQWNTIAKNLELLTNNKQLRNEVHKVPLLDYRKLSSYKELRLAHLQLSLISGCYIWQEGDQGVPKVLPQNLAIPWWGISEVLGIKPVLGHPSLALANWCLVDPESPMSLENLRCIYSLPGGREAEWFIIVTINVEYEFAKGLHHLISALNSAETENEKELINSLNGINETISNMKLALGRMHDELSAETFYNTLRPFLAGWGGEGSPLEHGLIYEGVSTEPFQMIGASAAQSSTCQSYDAAFGIDHNKPDIKDFLATMRHYMPPSHRQFIEEIERRTKIKPFVKKSQNQVLKMTFNDCLTALIDFRSYHIQIVTKYIVVASTKKNSNYKYESVSDKGTGGTSILPFLKTIRESAVQQKIHKS